MTSKILLLFCGLTMLFYLHANSQGILRQEAYRFDVSEVPRKANLGENMGAFVEDSLGQVWAENSAFLMRLGTKQTEIFATSGTAVLPGVITRLFTDSRKSLWVSTSKGLFKLDPKSQQFIPHYIKHDGQLLKTSAINVLGDYIFCASSKGDLIRYHPATRKAGVLNTGVKHGYIPFVHRTKTGALFFADRSHLYQITDSNRMRRICALPPGEMPWQAENAGNNTLYVSLISGPMFKVNLTNGKTNVLPLASGSINNGLNINLINWQGKNYIVQGTNAGLVWLNPDNDEQVLWGSNPLQKGTTIAGLTNCALQDKFGRIWIGNDDRCLSLPVYENNTTPYFLHEAGATSWDPGEDAGPGILSLDKQNGAMVYGIADTLVFFDSKKGSISSKIALGVGATINDITQLGNGSWIAATNKGIYKIENGKAGFFSDSLKTVKGIRLLVKADTVFAGTYTNGLYVLTANGRLLEHHDKSTGMQGNYVPAFCLDKTGTLWFINGRSGLYVRRQQPEVVKYDASAIGLSFVYDIVCDKDSNKLWIGGNGGILSYNIATGKTGNVTPSISSGFEFGIWRLYQKNDGNMFVSTNGNKLFEWDLALQKVLPIAMEKGWWGENLKNTSALAQDADGNWWASFRYGLLRFNSKTFLGKKEVQQPQLRKLELLYKNWTAHPSFYSSTPLVISYRQTPLSIICSSSTGNNIQFKLQGYDDEWQDGARATYANLDGGNYQFMARSVDDAGNVSKAQTMQLKVLPPFYKTWWFRLLAGLSLAAIIYFIVQRRIESLNKENSFKLRLAESELKAIRSQMNPHFIFNCMTAIDGLIAKNERAKASEYLGKFSKLMRHVLQLSGQQFIVLNEELDTLKLYLQLEQLRMHNGFTYEIIADDELKQTLEIPPLLLQPFVENAIIHGLKPKDDGEKHLSVTVQQQEGKILFTILDNGIGRQAAQQNQQRQPGHVSSGMQLTTDRLQLLKDALGYNSSVAITDLPLAAGTQVQITLTKTM